MQFSGEFTLGALGIIVSIFTTAISGISTMVMIYNRTRNDINALQAGHTSMKTDVVELKGKMETLQASFQKQEIMLDRIATRQQIISSVDSLPDSLAVAIKRLQDKEKAA